MSSLCESLTMMTPTSFVVNADEKKAPFFQGKQSCGTLQKQPANDANPKPSEAEALGITIQQHLITCATCIPLRKHLVYRHMLALWSHKPISQFGKALP